MDQILDVVLEIVSHLPSLQDLHYSSLVSQTFHKAVAIELRNRIRYLLTSTCIPSDCYSDFINELGDRNSVASGDVVHLLCSRNSNWSTLNTYAVNESVVVLKIICPRDSICKWKYFFEKHGFSNADAPCMVTNSLVNGYAFYGHEGMRGLVAVLQSVTRSPFTVLLGEKSSAKRQGLNNTHIFDLHPQLTKSGMEVTTDRNWKDTNSMRLCHTECTGQWYNLDPSVPTKIDLSTRPYGSEKPAKSRPLFMRYQSNVREENLSEYCRRHAWSPKGCCVNVDCVWFSVDLKSSISCFAADTNVEKQRLIRIYSQRPVPTGLLYGCERGDLDYVPVPPIVNHRQRSHAGELRYDLWLQCPILPSHLLYWGDLEFVNLPMESVHKRKRYVLCSNLQSTEGLQENQSLYSAMKGLGYARCPIWNGNLLVVRVEGSGFVTSLSGYDKYWVNKAVCRSVSEFTLSVQSLTQHRRYFSEFNSGVQWKSLWDMESLKVSAPRTIELN
ncbi:hypothetical protein K435DRAFT_860803 [Dendrothele bispora CBS 962.96]|uniref:Uncharacterized protein n=1 Tax=Dendrothele bispora (strain CBS 962.96) TaxID=1314807 RepID=A0A4S8LWW1_DENBC|nr:hypothetical protein K435DRAFT_860803 [Dendrothele bispora CBS 962.96]